MKLKIERRWRKNDYTIGILYVDGVRFCETIEDKDRGLYQWQGEEYIKTQKVYGETAIPQGVYKVVLSYSPKFSNKTFYKAIAGSLLPEIKNVKGFSGIRIHCGNTANDSLGCILVGENKKVGKVLNSQATYKRLMEEYLYPAFKRGEEIKLKIC